MSRTLINIKKEYLPAWFLVTEELTEMKRPILAARKVGKLSTELLERCQGDTSDLGMITMKMGRLETEWNTFDTLYTQWVDTVDEQDIDQHHKGYQ